MNCALKDGLGRGDALWETHLPPRRRVGFPTDRIMPSTCRPRTLSCIRVSGSNRVMKTLLKTLPGATLATMLASAGALADGMTLTGSMWNCTRERDGSQFIIVFYPDGGVGGGELGGGEVSPYVFDASRTKNGQWPGRWTQRGQDFTWEFPDQHMRIDGVIDPLSKAKDRLRGTETALELTSPVRCTSQARAPRLGAGLVIPKDGHFMDPDDTEGELKVPTGVSLQPPSRSR